jgi:hypothetical protein
MNMLRIIALFCCILLSGNLLAEQSISLTPVLVDRAQKFLESSYNMSKEEYKTYRKTMPASVLITNVVLAHELGKNLDFVINFVKKYNKPVIYKEGKELQATVMLMTAVIYSKESGKSVDEILNLSQDGDPKKMMELEKTLKIDPKRFSELLIELKGKFGVNP